MNIKTSLSQFFNFLIPPTCISCDRYVEVQKFVCETCDLNITEIQSPQCPKCAMPRFPASGVDALCSQCISENRYFNSILAPFEYSSAVQHIFSRAKYGRRPDTVEGLASLAISRNLFTLPETLSSTIWTSVPMHPKDLAQRGFNTSRLLLDVLQKNGIATQDANLLRKTKSRIRGLDKHQRQDFAKHAFEVRKNIPKGDTVIVVDDVMSSGATLSNIARILKKSGAKEVICVVLARNI